MNILNQQLLNSIANAIIAKNTPPPTAAEIFQQKILEERHWRDGEMLKTDALVVLPDLPFSEKLIIYRQALRSYPQQGDFPNGERPLIDG
jgi:hypothetical protein